MKMIESRFSTEFIRQLIAEWYEYQGCYVRQGVQLQPDDDDESYQSIDFLILDPVKRNLIHLEVSLESISIERQLTNLSAKFEMAQSHYYNLVPDSSLSIERMAIVGFTGQNIHISGLDNVELMSVLKFLNILRAEFQRKVNIVPCGYPMLLFYLNLMLAD